MQQEAPRSHLDLDTQAQIALKRQLIHDLRVLISPLSSIKHATSPMPNSRHNPPSLPPDTTTPPPTARPILTPSLAQQLLPK